jgi:hypothetical protein
MNPSHLKETPTKYRYSTAKDELDTNPDEQFYFISVPSELAASATRHALTNRSLPQ